MEELGSVRQQIGEILGTVRSLADQMREQKDESRRQDDRIASEIRNIKHDQRQNEQILTSRLEKLGSQVKTLDDKMTDLGQMKEPVAKLIDLKNKIIAYTLIAASVGTIGWYILSPMLHSLFVVVAKKFLGG